MYTKTEYKIALNELEPDFREYEYDFSETRGKIFAFRFPSLEL